MKHVITIITVVFLFISAVYGNKTEQSEQKKKEAQTSAIEWLQLVDEGKYGESWDKAAGLFKGAVSQEQWNNSLTAARKPLGKLISRKVKSAQYMTTLPGAPDGEYVVFQFESSFANKKEAIETVTVMMEKDGKWKAAGYFIK
ncbi:MAG: hypothetical protein Kow00108_14570 [Calditrichia bacterium]